MAENNCESCPMRAKYDAKPKSFVGRFRRWHIKFSPGWKAYIKSLDETKRMEVVEKYQLAKP